MSLEDFSEEERELAHLSRQLANDPATRKEFLRLTKKIRPDVPMLKSNWRTTPVAPFSRWKNAICNWKRGCVSVKQ